MLSNIFPLTLSSPGYVAFHMGPLSIRWYGILIGIGFLVAYFLAERLVKKTNLSLNSFNDLVFLILVFSIVFARLWFVFLNFDYYRNNLDEIPKIWYGGQSIHGGLLGGILASLLYTRFKKISFYKYIDIAATVVPLAQAIGRWGNFFNNEAFGMPVRNSFIQLYIPKENRPLLYTDFEYFHPTFLYESFFDLIIFIFLYKKYYLWREKQGKIFWTYIFWYSFIRFFIEFIRIDSLYIFNLFPSAQFVSVILMIISLLILRKKYL